MYHQLAEAYDTDGSRQFSRAVHERLRPVLERWTGERIFLDLACGTGNLGQALLAEGWEVHGVDRSQAMLDIACGKAKDSGAAFTTTCADLREMELPRSYPLVGCFYDALNHLLSPTELVQTFRRVEKALSLGGRFLFDVTTFETYRELWQDTVDFIETDEHTLIIQSRFDEEIRLASAVITGFLRRGDLYEKRSEDVCQYCFTDAEIYSALREAGLDVESVSPFNPYPHDGEAPLKTWWIVRRREDS